MIFIKSKQNPIIAKLFKIYIYLLIVNYYVTYRLVLIYKDARKKIEFYKKAELLIKKIYNYFKNLNLYI